MRSNVKYLGRGGKISNRFLSSRRMLDVLQLRDRLSIPVIIF
jgi:hypothetical protein